MNPKMTSQLLMLAIVSTLIATIQTLPAIPDTPTIPILRDERTQTVDGSYDFLYETGNGIAFQERGYEENPGTSEQGSVKIGQFQFYDTDGSLVSQTYIADRNGFRTEGTHVPKKPPTPAHVKEILNLHRALGLITEEEYNTHI